MQGGADPQRAPQRKAASGQFSLKSIFGLMTALSIFFGLLAVAGPVMFVFLYVTVIGVTLIVATVRTIEAHRRAAIATVGIFSVVIVACPVIPALTSPLRSTSRPVNQGWRCSANLRRIGMALEAYKADFGALPPAYSVDADERRLHSWRTLLLPYLSEDQLYRQIRLDEPWNSPQNSLLHDWWVEAYSCPADFAVGTNTSYLAVTGPGTAWQNATPEDLSAILIVEVTESGVHWMEPSDMDFARLKTILDARRDIGICSHHNGSECQALHADMSVGLHRDAVIVAELNEMLSEQ